MSDIITSVFKHTIGALWNQARDKAAEHLQDGDLTDEQCRKLIVRSMKELQAKLDALSRKDLTSSICFLDEGATILASLDSSTNIQQTTGATSSTELANVVEAFSELTLISNPRFVAAKECFKKARENATEAFSNTALTVEDRVLACKIRVTARIMENIQEPNVARDACLSSLKQLHDIPAVQEAFTVFMEGGAKSIFNKKKRLELVESVSLINHVLYYFITTATASPIGILTWPTIKNYHTLLHLDIASKTTVSNFHQGLIRSYFRDGKASPNDVLGINSKREFIVRLSHPSGIVVTKGGEGVQRFFTFPEGCDRVMALAVSEDDTMYIITSSRKDSQGKKKYKLWIIDASGNTNHPTQLEFLNSDHLRIAVNKKHVIVASYGSDEIYILDLTGQYESRIFARDVGMLAITDENKIITAQPYFEGFSIYNIDGTVENTINITDVVKCPIVLADIGYCFSSKTVFVLVRDLKLDNALLFPYYLICYPETGNEVNKVFGLGDWDYFTQILSHPNGGMALISDKNILLF